MEWLTDLLGTGASVASGGLFGLFGSVVGVFAKVYQEKQRQEWEQKKWDQEVKMQELQMQAQAQETEQEVILANVNGSWNGLSSSQEFASKTGKTHMWVNDSKAMFRPFLTVTLWVIAAWVFYYVAGKGLAALSQAEVNELIKYMVYSIFFSASTATMWWFGDRALTPPNLK